jgi:hypothetical protein
VDAEVASGTDSWMLVASGTNSGLPRLLVEPFKVVGADGTLHGCQQNAPIIIMGQNNNNNKRIEARKPAAVLRSLGISIIIFALFAL